jgi:hypothetical protein
MTKKRNRNAAPPRRTGPPPHWDDPIVAHDVAPGDLDTGEPDAPPRVVVALFGDLGKWIPKGEAADRAAWFLAQDDAGLVGIFDRLPEGSMPPQACRAILAGLRSFSLDQSASLQRYIGPTSSIHYGFHVDATLDQIVESFEQDGFEVVDAVRDGRVLVVEGDDG